MSGSLLYFYWTRRTFIFPPSPWVAVGPFDSKQAAEAARCRSKCQFDLIVGVVFSASSLEAAQCTPPG